MKKRWLILLAGLAISGAVISQLPLSWIGPKGDFGRQTPVYKGTVWNGQVSGTDAGDLNLSTSILRLIKGQNPVHIKGGPTGLYVEAEAGLSGLRALKGDGTMQALALRDPRLGLVNGSFRVDIPDMKLMKICEYAKGTVWTDFLAQNSDKLRWAGPMLEGTVSCEDGQIVLDLTGQDRETNIIAQIRIDLAGTYLTDISAEVTAPEAGLALQFFGFHKTQNGYQLREQGKW